MQDDHTQVHFLIHFDQNYKHSHPPLNPLSFCLCSLNKRHELYSRLHKNEINQCFDMMVKKIIMK